MLVRISSLTLLRLFKVRMGSSKIGVESTDSSGGFRIVGGTKSSNFMIEGKLDLTTKVQVEGRISSRCLLSIVHGEFGDGQVLIPIILGEIDSRTQHLFQSSVGSFGLAIGLCRTTSRMKRVAS